MKLALSLLLGSVAMGCSSSDFTVSNAGEDGGGTGGDSVTADDSGTNSDVAVDTYVDPCAPEMGVAKFCVDVKLASGDHPGYDAASGSAALGIDGKGIVYVSLFDKDPAADLMGGPAPVPKAVLQYPPADHIGDEANIDKDLPITLTGRAPAGTYWVITQFADNKTVTRTSGESGVLPGDFVIVPNVNGTTRKAEYPKLTLTDGMTGRTEQKLRPYRRVNVDMGVTASLSSDATTNPTIHGDGPVLFAIYDGDINAKPANVLSVSTWPCMAVNPGKLPPTRAMASFGTTVDGEHNFLAVLFDYKVDLTASAMGNLWVQIASGGVTPIPKVNISATSWVSSTKADFSSVFFPYDAGSAVTDKNVCKG